MQLRQPPSSQPVVGGGAGGGTGGRTDATTKANRATLMAVALATSLLAAFIWMRTDGNGGNGGNDGNGGRRNQRAAAAIDADLGRLREVASKLKAAGALDEAAALYAAYLQRGGLPPETHAKIAYSLGSLYLEAGHYERALRWFYEAESAAPDAVDDRLGQGIVHALERMGRVHAAKAALADRVEIDASGKPKRAGSDPVVARIGAREVRASDITRELDDLPPELSKLFAGARGQQEFLRNYVADELLLRKAQKLEYDKDPELRRRLGSAQRQIIVRAFIEKEVVGKVAVDAADLDSYFKANHARYDQPEAVKLRMLKLKSQTQAEELRGKAATSQAFAQLAKQQSLDTATRAAGGLVDRWVTRGEALWTGMSHDEAVAVGDAVFASTAGKTSAPVAAGGGYWLFHIESVRAAKPAAFDDVRAQVERDYRMMKTQAAYQRLVDEQLKSEDVELFADRLAQVN